MDRDDVLISSILPMLPLAVSSISRFPLPLSLTFFQKSLHWALNLSVGFFFSPYSQMANVAFGQYLGPGQFLPVSHNCSSRPCMFFLCSPLRAVL